MPLGASSVSVGGFHVALHPLPDHQQLVPVAPAAEANPRRARHGTDADQPDPDQPEQETRASILGEPPGDRWYTVARDRASAAWDRLQEWVSGLLLTPGTTLKRWDSPRWRPPPTHQLPIATMHAEAASLGVSWS